MASPSVNSNPENTRQSRFEKHPKLTIVAIGLLVVVVVLSLFEFSLRFFLGLGDPVLYQSSPLYGYRLQASQLVHRGGGAEIRVNNLGLRADRDWDANVSNKILFLGNSVTYGGSYISNPELFSQLAVEGLEDFVAGNAGVNGWGIENIHALVVDLGFQPASIYVSVLQEMDFYRGLSKLAGKPFWAVKPHLAVQELLYHFYSGQMENMYEGHDRFVSEKENEKTVERAAMRLKEMDDELKSRGFVHLIYLSANRPQLLNGSGIDPLVKRSLLKYGINVIFMKDRPEVTQLGTTEKEHLFYDWNHLNKEGHIVWAKMIRNDLENVLAGRMSKQSHM
jgi:hypothetical protein